jgi:uncharacterized protein YjbI with pentapeptide repeats
LLFAGAADEVSGRPRSLFSNRLVLTHQSFDISLSFRGRDLSHAVLNGADLRKADFTGAMLNRAGFFESNLQDANFACAYVETDKSTGRRWPDDGCTWLQGATFNLAVLQGASFIQARLKEASFSLSLLQDANLHSAELQGASLGFVRLQGASLVQAQLQGAWLVGAQLQGASLDHAKLQGADLEMAHLQGASLQKAQLQGALLAGAQLQGALLDGTQLQGASLANAGVWRARGGPEIDLTDLDGVDPETKPWEQRHVPPSTFSVWRDSVLKAVRYPDGTRERLSALDPAPENEPKNSIHAEFWKKGSSATPQSKDRTVALLTDLACSRDGAPYVARGLLRNGRMKATGSQIAAVVARLRKGKSDQATCLGVKHFADRDWESFDALVAAAPKPAPDEKTK